ncbi:unnamed protein product [Lactuca virosa]|uniref:Ubiquitin-like domain-containing protein n=1 Tax=Lactuca virosa TaxID=75947 RepID=A0AAU9PU67_9ASTR|nr:unnamed protein product [Lactuca virosa]
MGFKSLLKLEVDELPSSLGLFVIKSFDIDKKVLKVINGEIKVDRQSVNEMLGIPMGDQKVEDLSFRPAEDKCYNKWISQYHKAENIRLNDITNAIIPSKEADFNFKLNFIVLFCNTLVESTPAGKINQNILKKISSTTDFSKIDWCSYTIESLINNTRSYVSHNCKGYFYGPLTYLLLLYVDHVQFDEENDLRLRPTIKNWDSIKMKKRETSEMKVGMFGTGKILERLQNITDKKIEDYLSTLTKTFESLCKKKSKLISTFEEAKENFQQNEDLKKWEKVLYEFDLVKKDRVQHKFYNIDGEPDNLKITQKVQTTLENQHLPKACVQVEHIIEGERLRKLLNDLRQSNYSEQDIISILNITKEQLKEFDDFFHKSKEIPKNMSEKGIGEEEKKEDNEVDNKEHVDYTDEVHKTEEGRSRKTSKMIRTRKTSERITENKLKKL